MQLFEKGSCGLKIYNLARGRATPVLEVIAGLLQGGGAGDSLRYGSPAAGDIPTCYADCTKAYNELGWKAKKSLDDMCADALRWQRMNPNGFADQE